MFTHRLMIAVVLAVMVLAPSDSARAEPTTAQVCAETARVLVQLDRELDEASLLVWAMANDSKLPDFHRQSLRQAIKDNRVDGNFDYIALRFGMDPESMTVAERLAAQPRLVQMVQDIENRVRAMTGRKAATSRTAPKEDLLSDLLGGVRDNAQQVDPEILRKEADIRQNHERTYSQVVLRVNRMNALNCYSLPAPSTTISSTGGSLAPAAVVMVAQNHKDSLPCCANLYSDYQFSPTSVDYTLQNDPPDRRHVHWDFVGIPASLSPEDEFTIRITGQGNFQPPGTEMGANYSASVRAQGLTQVKAQNAYFYQGKYGEGEFSYKVPRGATKVVIEIGSDSGGTFARYCYGACTP